jgi:hypothetical protein
MSIVSLRTRRDLCHSLQALSGRQSDALAQRDYDGLIELLGEKRSVIDRIAALTGSVREWSENRSRLPAAERLEGEALVSEMERLLEALGASEQAAVEELAKQRDATRGELLEINSAGRVHSAYRDTLAPATRRSLDVNR